MLPRAAGTLLRPRLAVGTLFGGTLFERTLFGGPLAGTLFALFGGSAFGTRPKGSD